MREVMTHHIANLPETYAKDLRVFVGDPDEHGVPHQYWLVHGTRAEDKTVVDLPFQAGDPRKGWNGGTSLAYLAAVLDFLMQCQLSKFGCEENQKAIGFINAAICQLQLRIERRAAAGTFQTHQGEKTP